MSETSPPQIRYSKEASNLLANAVGYVISRGSGMVSGQHLLLRLMQEPDAKGYQAVFAQDITPAELIRGIEALPPDDTPSEALSDGFVNFALSLENLLFGTVYDQCKRGNRSLVTSTDLLWGLLKDRSQPFGALFEKAGFDLQKMIQQEEWFQETPKRLYAEGDFDTDGASNWNRLSPSVRQMMSHAQSIAEGSNASQILPVHFLLAILNRPLFKINLFLAEQGYAREQLIQDLVGDESLFQVDEIPAREDGKIQLSEQVKTLLVDTVENAKKDYRRELVTGDFLAVFLQNPSYRLNHHLNRAGVELAPLLKKRSWFQEDKIRQSNSLSPVSVAVLSAGLLIVATFFSTLLFFS